MHRRRQRRRRRADEAERRGALDAALLRAASSIAWWIVGTAVYQVGRARRSSRGTSGALNPGVQTTLPPATSEASSAATRPWMWKSGITLRHRSVGPSPSVAAMFAAEVSRLCW